MDIPLEICQAHNQYNTQKDPPSPLQLKFMTNKNEFLVDDYVYVR